MRLRGFSAAAVAAITLLAGCERVSGLSDLEFDCIPESVEETCNGIACGAAVNNCGAAVACPDTCAPPFACEAGGVAKNTCGIMHEATGFMLSLLSLCAVASGERGGLVVFAEHGGRKQTGELA